MQLAERRQRSRGRGDRSEKSRDNGAAAEAIDLKKMVVGIDIGGSTTDAVMLTEGGARTTSIEANDPVAAAAGALGKLATETGLRLEQIDRIAVTGAGARALGGQLLGRPVVKVDEFTAIGIGGARLSGLTDALVVSMGTGTAIVSVKGREIRHFAGTGVGGGTLLGLARHMLGVAQLETLEEMAARGDLSRIDLTVSDIAGGPLGDLPGHATAANFGKLHADASPDDKALAIANMIVEVIASLSFACARACGHSEIVMVGRLTRIFRLMERIKRDRWVFGGSYKIPAQAEYATAFGAAFYQDERSDVPRV